VVVGEGGDYVTIWNVKSDSSGHYEMTGAGDVLHEYGGLLMHPTCTTCAMVRITHVHSGKMECDYGGYVYGGKVQ